MGPAGLAILGIMVLGGIIALVVSGPRRRGRGGAASLDLEFDGGEAEAEGTRPKEYPDFGTLLERMVLPLAAAHPGWERLDGAQDVPGQPIAWFDWSGVRYSLGGETHVRALLRARDWMREHPAAEPLVVQHTKGGAGRLALNPEIGWTDGKAVRIETA